jgi:dolichol-phosphate mannosyltransferase
MLECLRGGHCDLVVGSRDVPGGGIGDLSGGRVQISDMATRLGRLVYRSELADPMSGLFMLRRELLEHTVRRLSRQGFKLLLDILASSQRSVSIKELPYRFRQRRRSECKLDSPVWEFMKLIADESIGHLIPVRFALFALIGGLGLMVHLAALWTSLEVVGVLLSDLFGEFVKGVRWSTLLPNRERIWLEYAFLRTCLALVEVGLERSVSDC